jgi:single-strand DNA-binding protein
MNNLNSILLEGNLVRDPEISYTPKGTPVCNFSIASNRYYKQGEELEQEVSYFDVTVWNRLAEVCKEYLAKGRGVREMGRLKQDRWEDPEGKTRSKVHIVAERVEFKPRPAKKPEGAPDSQGADASDPAEAGKIKPMLKKDAGPRAGAAQLLPQYQGEVQHEGLLGCVYHLVRLGRRLHAHTPRSIRARSAAQSRLAAGLAGLGWGMPPI